jgi:hypothetical protein
MAHNMSRRDVESAAPTDHGRGVMRGGGRRPKIEGSHSGTCFHVPLPGRACMVHNTQSPEYFLTRPKHGRDRPNTKQYSSTVNFLESFPLDAYTHLNEPTQTLSGADVILFLVSWGRGCS